MSIQNRKSLGATVIALDSIDSTNLYAKSLAVDGVMEGTVVTAEEQTAGKGRLGRNWDSAKGENLTFSIILRPAIAPEKLGLISLMTATAVADVLREEGFPAETKWPNDILLSGRKVCGILSESVLSGNTVSAVIVGIGLNVNQTHFPPEIEATATSLALFRQKQLNREALLKKLFETIDRWYSILRDGNYETILTRWKELCGMLGKEITLTTGESLTKGIAVDIADDGALLFETGTQTNRMYAGDVSVKKQ